jgi:hypothetical protein
MASTALEAITEYLQESLEGTESLEGVAILWGPPVGDDRPAELVSIGFGPDGESGDAERSWAGLGTGRLNESITIQLAVEVLQTGAGPDLKPAYSRSVEVAGAVETQLRTDLHLGGLLYEPAKFTHWKGRYFRADKARGHRIFQTMTGKARI